MAGEVDMLQSNDYRCKECSSVQTLLVEKEDRDKLQPCSCGGEAIRMLGGHITRASYIDGVGRWKSVKEMRQIEKQIKAFQRKKRTGSMDFDTADAEISRLKTEKAAVQAKGRTKKAEIAPKVES